jgi:hypothetical protein
MTAALLQRLLGALRMGLLRMHHTQLALLEMRLELFEAPNDPTALPRCRARLAEVELEMLMLRQQGARR